MSEHLNPDLLASGVPGLDELLGGGLPRLSFNIIGGAPGSGKTTVAQQIMFALASVDRPALYFTALGEPPIKMLRYQQRFAFFDIKRVNTAVRFINLGADLIAGDFTQVLEKIIREVKATNPAFVFIDSFRSIIQRSMTSPGGVSEVQFFAQQLAMVMTSWQATTFLIGEYGVKEMHRNPIFTIADGILWFSQNNCQNAVVRKVQVIKMRGQEQIPGIHTFTIDTSGVTIYSRMLPSLLPETPSQNAASPQALISTGVAGLDAMLGGGLPAGYSMLLAGPSGSGKTRLATEFLLDGARRGESVVIATFEKRLPQFPGDELQNLVQRERIHVLTLRSLDLSTDEILHRLTTTLARTGATRLVFDSLSGFELALAPEFREDFRESLYRLVTVLTERGVTVVMTTDFDDRFSEARSSPYANAFLVDAIVTQGYVQHRQQMKTTITVIKLRGRRHSRDLRLFSITDSGIEISGDTIDFDSTHSQPRADAL